MTEHERIDEIIQSLSADYNRPPDTPREEMWAAIQRARQNAAPRLHVTAGGASTDSALPGRNFRAMSGPRFAWIGMAAAAVLLIAAGVGIGRWTSPRGASLRNQPVQVVAQAPAPVETKSGETVAPDSPTSSPAASAPAGNQAVKQRTREEILKNPVVVGKGGLRPVGGASVAFARPATTGAITTNVYQVATVRHLADAEALLTSFSLGSRDASMNAQFAEWARGLLSNTRLLLDSPAGDDPRRARLLQDLEVVLAQIVQLSPDARAEDRELIQGSIQDAHVMTRLRTAIPADSPIGILEK